MLFEPSEISGDFLVRFHACEICCCLLHNFLVSFPDES
jgi:hypothetical protein